MYSRSLKFGIEIFFKIWFMKIFRFYLTLFLISVLFESVYACHINMDTLQGHLGWMGGGKKYDSYFGYSAQSTTNVTSVGPTVSTSTSTNCRAMTAKIFILKYQNLIVEESSKGEGESLNALNDLLECPPENRKRFSNYLKENFNEIFYKNPENLNLVMNLQKVSSHDSLNECKFFHS